MPDSSTPRPFRLLGHPLHPMMVHLPLGALPLVTAADVAALWTGRAFWWETGFWLLVAGLAGILPAAISGFVDYLALAGGSPLERRGTRHMIAACSAAVLYLVRLLLQRSPAAPAPEMQALLVAIAACGAVALVVAGSLGGKLVHGDTETELLS